MRLKQDFGAIGDGIADDSVPVANFLSAVAGDAGEIEPGTYLTDASVIKAGTKLYAVPGSAILKAKPTLAPDANLLINATPIGPVDTYPDADITLDGITFDGSGLTSRAVELVSFFKCRRPTVKHCMVRNVGYIGLGFGGCRDVRVLNSEFTKTGAPAVLTEGGPALWFGYGRDGSHSINGKVGGCNFYDLEWAGIYGTCDDLKIVGGCDFRNVKEAAIFTGDNVGLVIADATIKGVKRKYISGSGIETGASFVTFANLRITEVDNCCVSLTDTQVVDITGGVFTECRMDPVYYPQGSGIGIVSTKTTPSQPRWITVGNVTFLTMAHSPYAFLTAGGPGDALQQVTVQGNNCAGSATYASGKAIAIQAGKWGYECIARNNLGAVDS